VPARLLVVASGDMVLLPDKEQVIIGRADPVSRFYPDVDLSPYQALQSGVGRRHLRMMVRENQVLIEDMNSTNGTFLRGQKLTPRMPQPINDGDELRLGTLTLRFNL
jgi:pSer/pThr/pTyr-binding forkhead associated (FHA) protein